MEMERADNKQAIRRTVAVLLVIVLAIALGFVWLTANR